MQKTDTTITFDLEDRQQACLAKRPNVSQKLLKELWFMLEWKTDLNTFCEMLFAVSYEASTDAGSEREGSVTRIAIDDDGSVKLDVTYRETATVSLNEMTFSGEDRKKVQRLANQLRRLHLSKLGPATEARAFAQ